jgi:tRNA (mo5U34)-methyltransferase
MTPDESLDLKAARLLLNTTQDLEAKGWYHSLELPNGEVIQGTQSLDRLERRLSKLPIPQDLRGKRVLDIGAWDGWFSFAMERRGAEVLAVDCVEIENFRYARRKLGSRVDYQIMDVFEITPERVGRFDIVLCLGVIYHLKHPLLAIERVCDLTTDLAIVESFVADENLTHVEYPWMEFYESDELGGQADNWSGPNVECLLAFCRTAGFARAQLLEHTTDHRASVACYRHWDFTPADGCLPGPSLQMALHSQNNGINFSSARDEYVSAWFLSDEALTRDSIFPEIGGYGVKPIYAARVGDNRWQINVKLPPGLPAGWQQMRIRTANSLFSNPIPIAIDVPVSTESLHVKSAYDSVDWKMGRVEMKNGRVTLWVSGLPSNADLNNVRVDLGPARLTLDYLQAEPDGEGYRQVNARLPRTVETGAASLVVSFGGVESNTFPVEVFS